MHVPFCVSKCRYCDFNSHEGFGRDTAGYVNALAWEIERRAPAPARTIFLGGGTPTYLDAESLRTILAALARAGALERHDLEFTVEANPESATEEKLQILRAGGANRLSLGVQSFDEAQLRRFDRAHSVADVRRAVVAARSAGFVNFNLDLIFAKEGETLESWRRELDEALALEPQHLSCYELTFEPATALARDLERGRARKAEESLRSELFHFTIEYLASSGFQQYEVSAFARPGRECRHNLVYWTSGSWIGVGAGATTALGASRATGFALPETYARAIRETGSSLDPSTIECSTPKDRFFEVLMMGLRLRTGIPAELIVRRSGEDPLRQPSGPLWALIDQGLLELRDGWLAATPRGFEVLDSVLGQLL